MVSSISYHCRHWNGMQGRRKTNLLLPDLCAFSREVFRLLRHEEPIGERAMDAEARDGVVGEVLRSVADDAAGCADGKGVYPGRTQDWVRIKVPLQTSIESRVQEIFILSVDTQWSLLGRDARIRVFSLWVAVFFRWPYRLSAISSGTLDIAAKDKTTQCRGIEDGSSLVRPPQCDGSQAAQLPSGACRSLLPILTTAGRRNYLPSVPPCSLSSRALTCLVGSGHTAHVDLAWPCYDASSSLSSLICDRDCDGHQGIILSTTDQGRRQALLVPPPKAILSHRQGLAVACAILPQLDLARYAAWLDLPSRMFVLASPTASLPTYATYSMHYCTPLQPPVGC
ncbi:hypothetical protein C8Q74DRAFT_1385913 [Fomes fomentarius]|nr:hypothetical protein C8Q74DRAFT_1385913 [Fomes fomentarius]